MARSKKGVIGFKAWCYSLQQNDPTGLLLLSNMLHDCRRQRIPISIFSRFRQEVNRYWQEGIDPIAILIELLRKTDNTNDPYYCNGPSLVPKQQRFSRVMEIRDLLKNNISPKYWKVTDRVNRDYVKELIEERFWKHAIGYMKTGRPFAWVVQTEVIDQMRSKKPRLQTPNEWVDPIRDGLGLLHHRSGAYLVEIQYPQEVFDNIGLRAPLFLDGSANPVFTCRTYVDGSGMTFHLKECKPGVPEAIHEAVEFRPNYNVKDIGQVMTDGESHNFEQLSPILPDPWEISRFEVLFQELESYGTI